ncbi:MAG: hypothetical protein V4510_09365 [bacterium]
MAEEGRDAPRQGTHTSARPAATDAEKEAVSYEMLQDLLRSERRSNKLMPVTARFWFLVREFLEAVTNEFRAEQAKDPFSRKVMLLTDEVKNARHAAESLWALRERKLAMLALAATKDRKRPEGVTPDEAELYDGFLQALGTARTRLFDGLLPPPTLQPPPVPVPSPAPGATTAPPVQMPIQEPPRPDAKAPVMSVPVAPPPPATAAGGPGVHVVPHDTTQTVQMVTIRALGDIPPFVGPDMQTYLLKAGDLATVPPSIANLLVRRNKAAIVNMG